jgi:hypothetical protein
MVKYLVSTFIFIALLSNGYTAHAQIEELLEREAPQFRMTILPLGEEGVVEIEVYFSHSRLSNLEASFWMIDRDDNRLNEGVQKMIAPLQRMNNREPNIIRLEGLKHNNFYAFGLDYRRISPILNTKFTTRLLQEGYQYQYISISNNYTDTKEDNAIFPNRAFSSKNVPECEPSTLTLQIEAQGYCQDNAMPAVLISNARNQVWEFTIETRTKNTDWRPLLPEGKRQKAEGAVTRIEPLCLLNTGVHSLRVLAWGEGCNRPVTAEIQQPIVIGSAYAYTSTEKDTPTNYELPRIAPTPTLPDTCIVRGKAEIIGNRLMGSVELDKYSLCGDFSPYTIIRYVNPNNRDLALEPIPLALGKPITFEFNLEDKDLARTIHPVNVVTYIRDHVTKEDRIMSAFWIRSDQPKSKNSLIHSEQDDDNEVITRTYPDRPINPPIDLTARSPLTSSPSTKLDHTANTPKSYENSEPTIEEEMNAFNVVATDPNCTPINDLRMVYDLNRSNKPLYISWINPRCCQEDGCEYTVWSGKTPDQLNLVIKGFKPGAVIKELLDPNRTEDTYYEVVVKTKNGSRKAAYLIGEGAKYGIEEILEIHDRYKPVKSDSLKFIKTNERTTNTTPKSTFTPKSGNSGATFKWDNNDGTSAHMESVTNSTNYVQPKLPITKFQPCKSQEQIQLVAKQHPIQIGDKVTMQYNYDREGYKYTLYFQPQHSTEWVIAPQTQELHTKAQFSFQVDERHNGDYKMLLYKVDKGWGCLTPPLSENDLSLIMR